MKNFQAIFFVYPVREPRTAPSKNSSTILENRRRQIYDQNEIIHETIPVNNSNKTHEVDGIKSDSENETDITEMSIKVFSESPESSTLTSNRYLVQQTSEMSMAEKSRLSILRKSKKKDRLKEFSTKKPPVLLKVTSKINTVVMLESVEHSTSDSEELPSALEVSNDSKETLNTVKKLMRTKLVKNAKSMNDLIDNWDEMICDYIDVNLLKNEAFVFLNIVCMTIIVPTVSMIFNL